MGAEVHVYLSAHALQEVAQGGPAQVRLHAQPQLRILRHQRALRVLQLQQLAPLRAPMRSCCSDDVSVDGRTFWPGVIPANLCIDHASAAHFQPAACAPCSAACGTPPSCSHAEGMPSVFSGSPEKRTHCSTICIFHYGVTHRWVCEVADGSGQGLPAPSNFASRSRAAYVHA